MVIISKYGVFICFLIVHFGEWSSGFGYIMYYCRLFVKFYKMRIVFRREPDNIMYSDASRDRRRS